MGDLKVGPVAVCSQKQKGRSVSPGNTGLIPAPPPPGGPKGIPVPTVIEVDTGKPDSERVQKVKHNGGDANNARTIFKGVKGDPMHVGDLPPGTPKRDLVSWVKENLAFTVSGHPTCHAQKKGFVMVGAVAGNNAGSRKAQSFMAWDRDADEVEWKRGCENALIACGINPDGFGSYTARNKAQAQARKDWIAARRKEFDKPKSQWPNPATQKELEAMARKGQAKEFVEMQSNSGHCIQNNFFQSKRGDSCTNYPPTRDAKGKMTDSGGLGYKDNDAFCTDHMGEMRVEGRKGKPKPNAPHPKGTEHEDICKDEGVQRREILDREKNKGKVTMNDIRNNARRTARRMVDAAVARKGGSAPGRLGKAAGIEEQRRELGDQARQRVAEDLSPKRKSRGRGRGARAARGGSRKRPSSGATKAQMDQAVECIATSAEQALLDQVALCADDGTTNGKTTPQAEKALVAEYNHRNAPKKVTRFDQLPPAWKKLGPSKTKQLALEEKGAHKGSPAKKPHPTQEDCLQHQAEILHQERVMSGKLPDPGGRIKPTRKGRGSARGATRRRRK